MGSSSARGVLESDAARSVIARLRESGISRDREAKRRIADRETDAGGRRLGAVERAELCRDAPLAVTEEVAALLYVLARRGGGRIVEFGGSLGISTIHLAAGLMDHGQGSLITTAWDREQVIEALQRFARELGRAPTKEECDASPDGYPSASHGQAAIRLV